MYWEYGHWDGGTARRWLKQHRNEGLELVYLSRGTMQWSVEGRSETVLPGSLFFTLPWQWHGSSQEESVGGQLSWLVVPTTGEPEAWRFAAELGFAFQAADYRRLRQGFAAERHAFPASPAFGALLRQAIDQIPEGDHLRMRSLVQAVVSEALHFVEQAPVSPLPAPVTGEDDSLARVRQWIAATAADPFASADLETAAAACGLARSRFAELVERETGDSPMRYRTRRRIDVAAALLRDSDASITEIALDCGFASSQHFARVFKRYLGRTPTAHRRRG